MELKSFILLSLGGLLFLVKSGQAQGTTPKTPISCYVGAISCQSVKTNCTDVTPLAATVCPGFSDTCLTKSSRDKGSLEVDYDMDCGGPEDKTVGECPEDEATLISYCLCNGPNCNVSPVDTKDQFQVNAMSRMVTAASGAAFAAANSVLLVFVSAFAVLKQR